MQTISITSFGARLRVREGLFEVVVPDSSGRNYHLKEQIPAHEVSTIILHPKTSVSADAMLLALQFQVDMLVADTYSHPQGRLLSKKPNSTINIWHKQLRLADSKNALSFPQKWLTEKLRYKAKMLEKLMRYRDEAQRVPIATTIEAMRLAAHELNGLSIVGSADKVAQQMRGIEGRASVLYFQTVSQMLPEKYRFEKRSRRPAQDLFNAALNYAYAILYSMTESALVRVGLCPYIGLMHSNQRNQASLVFDFVEPFRVWMDKVVIRLCTHKILHPSHLQAHKGGVWLNRQGKRILSETVLAYMSKKKCIRNGKKLARKQGILYDAQVFASTIRNSSKQALLTFA